MRHLPKLSNEEKASYMGNQISNMLVNAINLSEEWFYNIFIEKKPNEEELTEELIRNLDSIFKGCIWISEIMKNAGLKNDADKSLEYLYNFYTRDEYGYRYLVQNPLYDCKEHRLLTAEEVTERERKMDILNIRPIIYN